MPVAGASSVIFGTSGKSAGEVEASLGLFGALLELAGQTVENIREGESLSPEQQMASLTELLATAKRSVDTTITAEASDAPLVKANGEPLGDPIEKTELAPLIDDLINVLAALQQAAPTSDPVDPLLEQRAVTLLDKLGAVLGLDPAPTTPEHALSSATAQQPAGFAPSANTILPTTAQAAAGPPSQLPRAEAIAIPSPLQVADADADGTLGAEPMKPEAELPPALKTLTDKLVALADKLQARAPVLAERLQALADQLTDDGVSASILAKITEGAGSNKAAESLEAIVARLLAPDVDSPAPASSRPSPFTAPVLALPGAAGPNKPDEAKPGPDLKPADVSEREAPTGQARKPVAQADRPERAEPPAPTRAAAVSTQQPAGPTNEPALATTPAVQPAASAAASNDARAVHAAYSAPVRQINIPQVAFEIVRNVQAGASRFQIRLDPPELGRIDVKLDLDAAGNVNARMTVDRAETLDLMQRDQRTLERALAQAGLDSSKTNLEFSLRQNPFSHQEQQHQQGQGRSPYATASIRPEADDALPAAHVVAYRGTASAGGLNLFV